MSGVERIAAERHRQIVKHGWTPTHDATYTDGEMVRAAVAYAETAGRVERSLAFCRRNSIPAPESYWAATDPPDGWPWHPDWWKPSDDPIRNLEKAGALIAAEIDRLERVEQ